jgi:hypothetical protein
MRHYYAFQPARPDNLLYRFPTKKARDSFLDTDANAEVIPASDPRVKRTLDATTTAPDSMSALPIPNPTHYIGSAGLSGYISNYCEAYETRRGAAESLATMHDLSEHGRVYRDLMRNGHAYLPKDAGNEYAAIDECDCNAPWEHSEDDSPDNWPDYPQPEEEEN